jgi:hypothetical protein
MHFDIGELFKSIAEAGTILLRLLGVAKPMLDTTKTGLEVFEESKKLLEAAPEPEKPEQVTERVRAAADLMRSFTPVAFAEVLLWALRAAFLLGLVKAYLEFYRIHKGQEVSRIRITLRCLILLLIAIISI